MTEATKEHPPVMDFGRYRDGTLGTFRTCLMGHSLTVRLVLDGQKSTWILRCGDLQAVVTAENGQSIYPLLTHPAVQQVVGPSPDVMQDYVRRLVPQILEKLMTVYQRVTPNLHEVR